MRHTQLLYNSKGNRIGDSRFANHGQKMLSTSPHSDPPKRFRHTLATLFIMTIMGLCQSSQGEVSYLDNGNIKIGVDLNMGGSITYISESGSTYNVVNSYDLGREIQQSYYSGPYPYDPNDTQHPSYIGWGWNPIQSGDVYWNSSIVLDWSNNGSQLYVKTLPMQWALDGLAAECYFETWITLNDNVATVHCRLTNQRTDTTLLWAKHQELPAVYTIGELGNLITYNGTQPFTGAAVTEIVNSGPPWTSWQATENWSAFVNDDNWGLGVYHPGASLTTGGFAGTPGTGGPYDSTTGYIAPLHTDYIDANIVYDYEYNLILGSLTEIRDYVYANPPLLRPDFNFTIDRQHWVFSNAYDTWPVEDKLHLTFTTSDPRMYSPFTSFQASQAKKLYVRAAYHLDNPSESALQGQLYWSLDSAGTFANSVYFPIVNDGEYHTYAIDLSSQQNWTGMITKLRLDPSNAPKSGDSVDIKFISFNPGYDADGLPTSSDPVWTANNSANSYATLVNSDGLSYVRMNSSGSTAYRPYYTYTGGTGTAWNVSDEFTYEIRARVVDLAGFSRASTVDISLLDGYAAKLYFLNNAVQFVTSTTSVALDATQWHTYRITGVKTSGVWSLSLYIDGLLASTRGATSSSGTTLGWGDFSASGTTEGGIWDIDYIRWNDQQAAAPVTLPQSPTSYGDFTWHTYPCTTAPLSADPAWSMYTSGSDAYITGSDYTATTDLTDTGYLKIDTLGTSTARCSYQYSGDAWNPTDEFTIRFRAKVLSNTGYTNAFQMYGGGATSRFVFSLNTTTATLGSSTLSLDATQWHVYTITGVRNGNAWTYVLNVDNTSSITSAGSADTGNKIIFGDTSSTSSAGGQTLLDYIRWNDKKAFLAPPQPWHDSYEGDDIPTYAFPVWIENYDANDFTTLLKSGTLTYIHIDSSASTSDKPYYTYTGGTGTSWNVVDEFTCEIRARVIDHTGFDRAGTVVLPLMDGNVARLYFKNDSVQFVTTANSISLDATEWHAYRITGAKSGSTWSLSLYVDGILVSTTGAVTDSDTAITWGDLSASGTTEGGVWDIDYIRWNDQDVIIPPMATWYAYNFKGDILPTAASPVWTEYGSACSKSAVVDGSYMQLDSRVASNPYYAYTGGAGTAWNLGDALTVEMRAQVVQQTGSTAATVLWLGTGTEGVYLHLTTTNVTFGSNVITLDTTQWHTYRVTATKTNDDWTWTLYIDDNSQSWTYAGSTSTTYKVNRLLFGDPGTAYGGLVNFDYIRWTDKSAVAMQDLDKSFSLPCDMDGWEYEYQKWNVADEALQQPSFFGVTEKIWLTTTGYSDFDASFQFIIRSGNEGAQQSVGLVYCGQTPTNYYWTIFSARDSEIKWYRSDAIKSANNGLGADAPGITRDEWHTARIVKSGSTHQVYLDGELLLTKTESTLADGAIGLMTYQAKAAFRNLTISGTKVAIRSTFTVPKLSYFDVATDAGAGGYEGFPSIARAANGDLIVVFYAGYKHVPSGPDAVLPQGGKISMVRSTDNGVTWSQPQVVYDGPTTDDHDPKITRLSDGRLAVSICMYPVSGNHKPRLIWSSDNGYTWGNLQSLDAQNPFASTEVPFSPIVELANGTLLLATYGTIYSTDTSTSVVVRRSTDSGQTWTWAPACIVKSNDPVNEPDIYEPNIVMLPSGVLSMISRQKMFYNTSTDGGLTWSSTQAMNVRGDAPYQLLTSDGILLCGIRYRGDANGRGAGTCILYSLDYGVTWSSPVLIAPVMGAYTSLIEMSDGRILVVYYTEGNSINGVGSDIRGVFITADQNGITVLNPYE